MFGIEFDIIMSVIFAVCALLLLTGKGSFILNSFRGKSPEPLAYDEKKLSISMGLCCVVMFFAEMVFIFLSEYTWVIVLALVAVIASFVIAIWYLKKYAKIKPEKKDSISQKVKDLQRKK